MIGEIIVKNLVGSTRHLIYKLATNSVIFSYFAPQLGIYSRHCEYGECN